MCRVLRVSPGGYYDWRGRPQSARTERREALVVAIKAVHGEVKARYGSPRIHAELVVRGEACCVKTVARLMRRHGIAAKTRRKFRCTTDSNHAHPVAENVVNRDFERMAANRTWTADITYVPMATGFMYLAAVIDWFSRYVIAWRLSNTLDGSFCLEMLEEALRGGRPEVFNTDQGVQFTAAAFTGRLESAGVAVSMDGRGRASDNVFVGVLHQVDAGRVGEGADLLGGRGRLQRGVGHAGLDLAVLDQAGTAERAALLSAEDQQRVDGRREVVEVVQGRRQGLLGEQVTPKAPELPGSSIRHDPVNLPVGLVIELLGGPHRREALAPAPDEIVPLGLDDQQDVGDVEDHRAERGLAADEIVGHAAKVLVETDRLMTPEGKHAAMRLPDLPEDREDQGFASDRLRPADRELSQRKTQLLAKIFAQGAGLRLEKVPALASNSMLEGYLVDRIIGIEWHMNPALSIGSNRVDRPRDIRFQIRRDPAQ